MTEIREGMLTCNGCALGTGLKLDRETAASINSHAIEMLAGNGVRPDDDTSGYILQCAAAIAVGVCRTYASGSQQLVHRESLPTVTELGLPIDNPYL